MKAKLYLSLAAAALLSACAVADDYDGNRSYGRHESRYDDRYDNRDERRYDEREERRDRSSSSRYECRNGLAVTVRHIGSDRIELRLDDKRTVMQSAVSGSGSRYVSNRGLFGTGAEWHEKGGNAAFEFKDPYGNVVETSCRAV